MKKHIFIDMEEVEESQNVNVEMFPARQRGMLMNEGKPLKAEAYGSVVDRGRQTKMFIQANGGMCVLQTEDGLNWEAPELGICGPNNKVIEGYGTGSVHFNPVAMTYTYIFYKEQKGVYYYTSPNGVEWTTAFDAILNRGCDSNVNGFWDPRIKRYVIYLRAWNLETFSRRVARAEVKEYGDLRQWNPPGDLRLGTSDEFLHGEAPLIDELPVVLKEIDDRTDIYTMPVTQHPNADNVYYAFPSILHKFDQDGYGLPHDGLVDVYFASSRDGIDWVLSDEPYVSLGLSEIGIDAAQMYMFTGMKFGYDNIIQYYMGANRTHSGQKIHAKGITDESAVFFAQQRMDGFTAIVPGNDYGTFITKEIRPEGRNLYLNVDMSGGGSVRVNVSWTEKDVYLKGGNYIAKKIEGLSIPDSPIRLSVELRNAKLYSFWFEGAW
jgi:hypothetical protein